MGAKGSKPASDKYKKVDRTPYIIDCASVVTIIVGIITVLTVLGIIRLPSQTVIAPPAPVVINLPDPRPSQGVAQEVSVAGEESQRRAIPDRESSNNANRPSDAPNTPAIRDKAAYDRLIDTTRKDDPYKAVELVRGSGFHSDKDKDDLYVSLIVQLSREGTHEALSEAYKILAWIKDMAKKERMKALLPRIADQVSGGRIITVESVFTPTGWMGDGEAGGRFVSFDGACTVKPHSGPTCTKVMYTFGPLGWAGICWLNKPDNWGKSPGNDYSGEKIRRLSFWARGETGQELVEFKTGNDGGITGMPYNDTFYGTTGEIRLSNEWDRYVIDLENEDLSSVITGFCWVTSSDWNKKSSVTFYLDDIVFE